MKVMSYPSLEDKQKPSRTPMHDSEQPGNVSCAGRLIPKVRTPVHTEQKAGGSPQSVQKAGGSPQSVQKLQRKK